MMIRVDDIDAQVSTLRDAGVEFEEYDLPGFKTENGLVDQGEGMRGGWCRDSEGNLLAILQMPDERFGIRHVEDQRSPLNSNLSESTPNPGSQREPSHRDPGLGVLFAG